jgi:hypothetical protein
MKRFAALFTLLLVMGIFCASAPMTEAQPKPNSGGSSAGTKPPGTKPPSPSPKPTPHPTPAPDHGSKPHSDDHKGGGKSYGSGDPKPDVKPDDHKGKSYGSGGTPAPDVKGKSYGSGSPPKPPTHFGDKANPNAGVKPGGSSKYDGGAGNAQKRVESRNEYKGGSAPAPSYKDSKGNEHKIDPKDKKIEQLRRDLDHEKWVHREYRQQQFYHNYYSRPVVYYHDPYGSMFWYWMLDRSLEERAYWAYHHRYDMDAARYNDLLAKDAQLQARINQLEAQNLQRDTSYVPKGVEPDLQYSDEYVDAVHNPQHNPQMQPHVHHDGGGVYMSGWACFGIFIVVLIVAGLIWLIFVKRW